MAFEDNITIDIAGVSFKTFKSVSVNESLDFFGKTFNIDINIPTQDADIFYEGQGIKLYLDDEPFLTGYIDEVDIDYSVGSCDVRFSGRDKVSDLIDSRISNKVFATPTTFENVLKKVLEAVGYEVLSATKIGTSISKIKIPSSLTSLASKFNIPTSFEEGLALAENQIAVINEYGDIEPFSNSEGIGFSKDESAYQLIQRLADKRRLVLGTDGNGNIIIRKIGNKQALVKLQNLTELDKKSGLLGGLLESGASATVDTSQNNIKDASVKRDLKNRYYEYKIISSSTGTNPIKTIDPATNPPAPNQSSIIDSLKNNVVQYSGVFYDKSVRKTRKFVDYVANLNNSQCKDRAEWECNIRYSKSHVYSCSIVGWRQGLRPITFKSLATALVSPSNFTKPQKNEPWQANQLVQITDNLAQVDDNFLIKDITYNLSKESGSFVRLSLVDKLSYTNSVFEPKIKKARKKSNKILKQLGIG
jgi:prophage tail gpP-like protein